jgi:hypothetical protein
MKKLLSAAAVAVALLLALAGCVNLANVSPGTQTAKTTAAIAETTMPAESPVPTEFIEATAAPEDSTTDNGLQGNVFTAASGRFSVEFPQGWTTNDSSSSGVDMVQSQLNDGVGAFVQAIPMPGVAEADYQAVFDQAMNAIAQGVEVTDSGTETFHGQTGYYYEFNGTTSGTSIHCAICFFVKDGVLYDVIFVSPQDQFDTYSDAFGQIFNSFQFLG